jgi:hypothetical protein
MKINRKAIAGVNVYTCPMCKGAGMGGVLYAKLGMRDYARMRAYGAITKVVGCSNENHEHKVEVVMERPEGSASIIKGG